MTKDQCAEISGIVSTSLDEAERVWINVGHYFCANESVLNRAMTKASVPSQIPGHPIIEDGRPKVDDFIALVVDIRGATRHLLQRISEHVTRVTELQRVFYETAALLPSCAVAIGYEKGAVTEYLGDGLLALFRAGEADRPSAIYAAHRAATNCLEALRKVINPVLNSRYQLPNLSIGIGMAYSRAIVTIVGTEKFQQPKAFGHCVFYATKLAHGENEIVVDKAMKMIWPTAEDGKISFRDKRFGDYSGYLLEESA